MSNVKELTHTLQIVLNKLEQCDTQQREITNKMSTKRTLLHASHQVLQKQYCSSLTQDYNDREKGIDIGIGTKPDKHMVSILGDTRPNATATEPDTNFNLIKCQGWIRGKRVWIQAQGIVLLNCIEQAYLCCLPSILIPDTVCLNSMGLQKDSIGNFHYTFDLLPDVSFGQLKERLKVYCLYDNYPSQTCEIEWRLDLQDLGWINDSLSISTHNVIQAYFPYFLQLITQIDCIIDLFPCTKYNDHLYIATDQAFCIVIRTNRVTLYGLTPRIVANIASHFDASTTNPDEQALIKSLGDEYVALLAHNTSKTRANISMILSEFI